MTEATVGFSTQGAVYGFKLHALTTPDGLIVKFAITPANEADVTVARALLTDTQRALTLGDKAYVGSGIYTPPKTNALNPGIWTSLMNTTRKMIESVFSSLTRTKYLVFGQRNSFRSIRAHTCRKSQLITSLASLSPSSRGLISTSSRWARTMAINRFCSELRALLMMSCSVV